MDHAVVSRCKDVILRDYCAADIDDEIRWMNVDTQWMKADTPWETYPPVDEAELRGQMMKVIAARTPNSIRGRLEIEKDGKHVGFVCSYFLDGNCEPLNGHELTEKTQAFRTLGIEICEPNYWGQGIGTKALSAFIDYYKRNGETAFLLETWSGNSRMVKCAEKLGFTLYTRKADFHIVEGTAYDALTLKLECG